MSLPEGGFGWTCDPDKLAHAQERLVAATKIVGSDSTRRAQVRGALALADGPPPHARVWPR